MDALDYKLGCSVGAQSLEVPHNPVQMEGRPGDNPEGDAEPFTANELSLLRRHADRDLLSFLGLRWTGFRGSDAVALSLREVHFGTKEVERFTRKRKKKLFCRSTPNFSSPWKRSVTVATSAHRPCLGESCYRPVTHASTALSADGCAWPAGCVPNVHPHRFRDTFAVDPLLWGASPYDVAKMLGDTMDTVEKHFMPFVRELREHARRILENGAGVEGVAAN
jgi:integrase